MSNYSPPYIYTGLYLEPDREDQVTRRASQPVTIRPIVIPYYVVGALLTLVLGLFGSLYFSI